MRIAVSILVTCVLALMTLGTVMLCSAPAGFLHNNFEKQLAFCVLGVLMCVLFACWDYNHLKRYSWWIYGFTMLMLMAVLVIGVTRGGARRWFSLGFMLVQPSELAKLALIVVLAAYIDWRQRQMDQVIKGLLYPILIAGPMLALILIEPDFGTTMLLSAVTGMMLFVAGVRWQPLVVAALAGLILLGTFIYLDPIRSKRVEAMLKKDATAETAEMKDVNFQSRQSVLAIGSGGLTGFGLGEGLMKLGGVPENHTDFIFSVIGEELGLAATLPVVLAYVTLFLCGLFVAWKARDAFGMYLGLGITFLMGLQAFINLGVATGVLPNKGLSLPFVSYGGSSLVMMMACVGLLLNIAWHQAPTEAAFAEPLDLPSNPAT